MLNEHAQFLDMMGIDGHIDGHIDDHQILKYLTSEPFRLIFHHATYLIGNKIKC